MDDAVRSFMTFLELERHASHETVRNYASDLRQFQTFMTTESPSAQVFDLTTARIESIRAYLHWLDRKREKSTSMARKLASLRSFYRYLQREGMVGLNPAEAIRTPKQPKLLPRVLSKDDAAALMEFPAGQTGSSLRDCALLETLYSTGARVSELVGINLDDLRGFEGLVHLRGKGRKERIVPIGDRGATGHSGLCGSAAPDGLLNIRRRRQSLSRHRSFETAEGGGSRLEASLASWPAIRAGWPVAP